jgi:hypothetical protein
MKGAGATITGRKPRRHFDQATPALCWEVPCSIFCPDSESHYRSNRFAWVFSNGMAGASLAFWVITISGAFVLQKLAALVVRPPAPKVPSPQPVASTC